VENEFLVKVSYAEVLNEQINDLLAPNVAKAGGVQDKVTEEICMNIDQIISLIRMGDINRSLGAKVAERGAKATTVLKIVIESFSYSQPESISHAAINLVDLAGSEQLQAEDSLASKSLSTLD